MVMRCRLAVAGRAGFFVDEDDAIRSVNPLYVYFDPEAKSKASASKYRKVRPIITDRKPLFVVKEGDQLWEIEFEDEQ